MKAATEAFSRGRRRGFALGPLALALVAACGARSGLRVPESGAATPSLDATADVDADGMVDVDRADRSMRERPRPVPTPGQTQPLTVVVGSERSCALVGDGTVRCWGAGVGGRVGMLGLGDRLVPTLMPGLTNIVQLSAFHRHVCAVSADGRLRCWGHNECGQLGDGTNQDRLEPVEVAGLTSVVQAEVGWDHTCALDASGGVYCWGCNAHGQLADGTTNGARPRPWRVAGVPPAVEISVGDGVSCSRTVAGRVYCWGNNRHGRLGIPTATELVGVPTLVPGIDDAVSIETDGNKHCSSRATGPYNCWGWASDDGFGDGTTLDRPSPSPLSGSDAAIEVSLNYRGCILFAGGEVRCWGVPLVGMRSSLALRVELPAPASDVDVSATHACAVVRTDEIYCWGSNSRGQLGNNNTLNTTTPTPVGWDTGTERCTPGARRPCYTGPLTELRCGTCSPGLQRCGEDRQWGASCEGEVRPRAEICNGLDDNCDCQTSIEQYSCGIGPCQRTVFCSNGVTPPCTPAPPRMEICRNNIDENCNGIPDDGCP